MRRWEDCTDDRSGRHCAASYQRGQLDEADAAPAPGCRSCGPGSTQAAADPAVARAERDAAGHRRRRRRARRCAPCWSRASTSAASSSTPTTTRPRAATWPPTRTPRPCSSGWPHERQVRLTGPVEQGRARAETEAYFATRPRGSQLGAWASPQSEVVASRAELDALVGRGRGPLRRRRRSRRRRTGAATCSRPDAVEFWQGRADRLHDRLAVPPRRTRRRGCASGSPRDRARPPPTERGRRPDSATPSRRARLRGAAAPARRRHPAAGDPGLPAAADRPGHRRSSARC